MKYAEIKYLDYCLPTIQEVQSYLTRGFVPWGSAFYHPKRKCCYQPMVKHDTNPPIKRLNLAKREEECLKFLMKGYSRKYIAKSLSCSVENVKKLTNKLKGKMKVTSNDALIDKVTEVLK
jgi:DNA-binding CsgD family transcriptional regulator